MVDSGATIHVTSRREFFSSYSPGNYGVVRIGNDNLSKVISKGDVYLETMDGARLLLRDVRHVPDMRLNLISVDKLDGEGYFHTFNNGQWKLTKGALVVARGKKESKLYVMETKISLEATNSMEIVDTVALWHKCLGHMSEKSMVKLARKKTILGLDQVHLERCIDCLAGKQNRVAFKSYPPSRAKNMLDLVHSDLCEADSKSLGGARYFVTFIDDHSRKTWVYVLKIKD
ncbi:Retrovirus-related Pol polyprotein from transposon TNT 1-94 [Linum grandiflorum]